MRTFRTIDVERLAAPISPEHPAGLDPRLRNSPGSPYRAIRSARSAARSAERQISALGQDKQGPLPNWKPVLDLAVQILSDDAKDLEIASYLIEALARLHGFSGLGEGYGLCRILVERYWDDLFPRPDEDGLPTRVAPLMGLNGQGSEGTLIVPLLNIPLADSPSLGAFGCAQFDQAMSLERIADAKLKARRIDQGAVHLKTFQEAVADTPTDFYAALAEDIQSCLEEFRLLTETLDVLCEEHAPHSSNIKNALLRCQDVVQTIAGDRIRQANMRACREADSGSTFQGALPATLDFCDEAQADEFDGLDRMDAGWGLTRPIPSRDHALMMLEAIAAFFRQTEPHSPIPYTLEQTVRWGRMPLPELLSELIPDQGARDHYFRMVGIVAHAGVT